MCNDANKNLDEAANVKYLEAGNFTLFRTPAGALRMTYKDEISYLWLKARRIFPFTYPTKYISIRNGNDEEIGIIKDLAALSKDYRIWIEDELDMRYFTPRVKSISAIKRRFGGIEWFVDTDKGAKRFITKGVHDTTAEIEPGRYMVTDVDGNRYEIMTATLDETSKGILDRLL